MQELKSQFPFFTFNFFVIVTETKKNLQYNMIENLYNNFLYIQKKSLD